MRRTLKLYTLFILLAAGAAQAADTPPVTLNRYTGTDRGYGANAYWLESKEGIVLVDALFLRPDAELLATLIASRQKPLAAIILTHPHVDHFGGLATMRRRFPDVKIYATKGTAEGVRPTHEKAYADGWIQAYGADYDAEVVVPDTIVESGRELRIAGMSFTLRSFGAMEASDNTVVYNKELDALFVGDALVNGGIYYLGEGRSAGSIEGMLKLGAAYPAGTTALPGHSDPGNLQLIVEENVAQVRAMRKAAETMAARDDARTEKGVFRDVVRARLLGAYGELLRGKLSYGLTVDMIARMNLAGLERELLGGGGAMSVSRVSLVVAMLLASAPFAIAQQDAGSKASEERAAFERALDAGLARLAFLEGSWAAEQATPDGKGGWKATGKSDVVVTKILNGRALRIEAESTGFKYLLHLTFDAEQGGFRVSAIDDQSGLLDVYEGSFDGAGALVVSNVASGTGYTYLGVHYSNRLRFQPRAAGGWEWLVDVSSDRGATWRPQLRALLTRAGARP